MKVDSCQVCLNVRRVLGHGWVWRYRDVELTFWGNLVDGMEFSIFVLAFTFPLFPFLLGLTFWKSGECFTFMVIRRKMGADDYTTWKYHVMLLILI